MNEFVLPDGSVAWSRSQCLQFLDEIGSTKMAVISGEFFRAESIGLVPTYDGWTCDSVRGELASDHALRSRGIAIQQINLERHDGRLCVLKFSTLNDAA